MYKQDKSKQPKKHANNPVKQIWQVKEEQCPRVQIKYGLNQQGIIEVEIQPHMMEGLKKNMKRPE
jgi:hypothetical protein